MTDIEMLVIEQTVRIDATPEIVWQYWVDPERMSSWWNGAARLAPEPGGLYRVELDAGPTMRGEYVELVPHERLVFTFGWEEFAPGTALCPGSTRVEVTLAADGDGTVLTLRHYDMPSTHAPDHTKGWEVTLGRLVELARV